MSEFSNKIAQIEGEINDCRIRLHMKRHEIESQESYRDDLISKIDSSDALTKKYQNEYFHEHNKLFMKMDELTQAIKIYIKENQLA